MSFRVPPVRRRRSYRGLGWVVGFVAILLLFGGCGVVTHSTQRDVTATVKDKDRVCSSANSDCKYLIFTDKGTFSDSDSLWYMKFNSSDVYGEIDRGQTYTFTVTGWRLPFFSHYPNVVKVRNGS